LCADFGDARKKDRSPQEKKALSYAKDRRNAYGENDKASRKLIPLRKATESRQDRRKVTQEVASLQKLDEEGADVLESSARHDVRRVGGWTKSADEPLGKVVAGTMQAREARAGRKDQSRERQPMPLDAGGPFSEADDPASLKREASRLRRTARICLLHARSSKHPETAKEFADRYLRMVQACEERANEIARKRTEPGR
jgi:hypothetical protein